MRGTGGGGGAVILHLLVGWVVFGVSCMFFSLFLYPLALTIPGVGAPRQDFLFRFELSGYLSIPYLLWFVMATRVDESGTARLATDPLWLGAGIALLVAARYRVGRRRPAAWQSVVFPVLSLMLSPLLLWLAPR